MKKTITTLALLAMSAIGLQAQNNKTSDIPDNKAKVYFIREKGAAILNELPLFIDNKQVCAIRNKRFASMFVDTGGHVFSVLYKTKPNQLDNKWDHFTEFKLEAGKIYYLNITYNYFAIQNFKIEEATENTANRIIPTLKEDICN